MEIVKGIDQQFVQLKKEMLAELKEIIAWWWTYMPDSVYGGFYGSLDVNNTPDTKAPKGVVLNSRILWTFSAAYSFTNNDVSKELARMAYEYITTYFIDKEYGGAYWSLDAEGKILDGKKQIYGLAFCIYGLSEYHHLTREENSLTLAIDLFNCIEQYSHDKNNGGYFEAFTRDWQSADDLRLSEKDDNESKTMNTHLHIIEAYANLCKVWKNDLLASRIVHLLDLFDRYFINRNNYHLHLFFDDDWKLKSSLQSFGHDIEAAWLLHQCAEAIGHEKYISLFRKLAINITKAAEEGLDSDGGLWYEYEPASHKLIKERHSWPQAELMVGFINAFQITNDPKYLEKAVSTWSFVKKHLKDNVNGEWFWGVNNDYSIIPKEKAGFWKCPYHNGRACMEIMTRLSSM